MEVPKVISDVLSDSKRQESHSSDESSKNESKQLENQEHILKETNFEGSTDNIRNQLHWLLTICISIIFGLTLVNMIFTTLRRESRGRESSVQTLQERMEEQINSLPPRRETSETMNHSNSQKNESQQVKVIADPPKNRVIRDETSNIPSKNKEESSKRIIRL